MGWLIVLALAALSGTALWRVGRLSGPAVQLLGTALLLGMAGYAWQAQPGLPGSPHAPQDKPVQEDSAFALLRGDIMGRFGGDQQWLDMADAMHRYGQDPLAVRYVLSGIADNPKSSVLWTGLGNALTLANDGQVTPPARFAFDRAAALAPQAPGPPFFLGLALIQQGQLDEGAELWRMLLARTPEGVSWREGVAIRLAMVERLKEGR